MPVLNDKNMRNHTIGGSAYGFSAARIDHLGASEYTLVVIAADVSGSVAPFRDQIERCVKQIVRACRRSVRADNLMLRLVGFNGRLNEVHGFKVLADCNEDDYDGAIAVGGSTALFDAAHNAIESIAAYGRDLASRHFAANAILFVVSDGEDNASTMTAASVGDALRELIGSEAVESTVAVLVGVQVQQADRAVPVWVHREVLRLRLVQHIQFVEQNSEQMICSRLSRTKSRAFSILFVQQIMIFVEQIMIC